MNSWDTDYPGRVARAKATRAFCEYMDKDDAQNVADRALCTRIPPTEAGMQRAKVLFAQGNFYLEENNDAPTGVKPIPTATKFYIYEPHARDHIVSIVLPAKGQLPRPEDFIPTDHYRCTYWPYAPNTTEGELSVGVTVDIVHSGDTPISAKLTARPKKAP